MKILIIDPDPEFALSAGKWLLANGWNSAVVSTADEGLAEIGKENHGISAAFVDCVTAVKFLNSWQVIDPALVVIAVTARPMWQEVVSYLEGNPPLAVTYLYKSNPDMGDQMVAALDRYVLRLQQAGFTVNMETFQTFYKGNELSLSPSQVRLFAYFLRNPNRRINYRELGMAAGMGDVSLADARDYLRNTVYLLRKRLKEVTGREVLNSVPYEGFLFKTRENGIDNY